MADSDVHEAIQLDADIDALVSPNVSQLWRAMHGYTAEATGAVAAHRALSGSTPALADVLAVGNDMGGHAITDGANSSLTMDPDSTVTLETDLDIEIHATVQDINVTADSGNINFDTDPDTGGSFGVDAGGRVALNGRAVNGNAVTISAAAAGVSISAATYVQIDSGFGAGAVRLLTDGALRINSQPIADDDLLAGFFGIWLDPTNGAAKIEFKAKTLDGTVVTGNLPLT